MNFYESYYLKSVERNETAAAMSFINEAKAFLRSKGIDQWQKGYPDEAVITGDISGQKGYFLMEGSQPLAYQCIDFDEEPAYRKLNGQWLSDTPYGVVHRLAVGTAFRGKGLATVSLRLAEQMMRDRKVQSFRIDTDENNEIMKHLLAKNGFTYCGTIWFDNSTKIAYEKLLQPSAVR